MVEIVKIEFFIRVAVPFILQCSPRKKCKYTISYQIFTPVHDWWYLPIYSLLFHCCLELNHCDMTFCTSTIHYQCKLLDNSLVYYSCVSFIVYELFGLKIDKSNTKINLFYSIFEYLLPQNHIDFVNIPDFTDVNPKTFIWTN